LFINKCNSKYFHKTILIIQEIMHEKKQLNSNFPNFNLSALLRRPSFKLKVAYSGKHTYMDKHCHWTQCSRNEGNWRRNCQTNYKLQVHILSSNHDNRRQNSSGIPISLSGRKRKEQDLRQEQMLLIYAFRRRKSVHLRSYVRIADFALQLDQ